MLTFQLVEETLPTQQKTKPVLKHSFDKGSKLLSLPVYHADVPVGRKSTSFLKHTQTGFKTVSSDKGSKLLSHPVYHADIPVGGRNSTYTEKNCLKQSSDKGSKLLSLPVHHADVGGRNTSFLKHSV